MQDCTKILENLRKLRRKAQTEARRSRKGIKNDTSHFEGVCKGEWLVYSWISFRLKDIIDESSKLNK